MKVERNPTASTLANHNHKANEEGGRGGRGTVDYFTQSKRTSAGGVKGVHAGNIFGVTKSINLNYLK